MSLVEVLDLDRDGDGAFDDADRAVIVEGETDWAEGYEGDTYLEASGQPVALTRPENASAALAAWFLVPWGELVAWSLSAQRSYQDSMARALRAIQSGEPAAVWALCSATAAYGFVHALWPGPASRRAGLAPCIPEAPTLRAFQPGFRYWVGRLFYSSACSGS